MFSGRRAPRNSDFPPIPSVDSEGDQTGRATQNAVDQAMQILRGELAEATKKSFEEHSARVEKGMAAAFTAFKDSFHEELEDHSRQVAEAMSRCERLEAQQRDTEAQFREI